MAEKKIKLPLLPWNREKKGVDENEDKTPTFRFFFKLLARRFSDLLSLNLLMLFQLIPLLVCLYVYWSRSTVPVITSVMNPLISGAAMVSETSSTSLLSAVFGNLGEMTAYRSAVYFVVPCMIVLTLVTFGWQNTGATYVLRGMVRSEPVSLGGDYWYGVRKNWKQALFLGMADVIILLFLVYDIFFFYGNTGSLFNDICFMLICFVSGLYLVMRFYMYLILVTFDLKNRKIIKNSLIFSILGFKRNFMAVLGVVVLFAINVLLFVFLMQFNIAIGLILPLFYMMAFPAFISAYAAYPVIKKYMIDPYYDCEGNPLPKDEPEQE